MNRARNGIYANYLGREYHVARVYKTNEEIDEMKQYKKIYASMHIVPNSIELVSLDRKDLLRGFVTYSDNSEGFLCIKVVKIEEIKGVFKYNSYADYCGIKCSASGPDDNGYFFIETNDDVSVAVESVVLTKLQRCGFKRGYMMGHGMFIFEKYVSPDDSNLQIFEERTEIDVNSL